MLQRRSRPSAHRLTAAEKLGWKEIECVVLSDCTEDDAELVEIDENLARASLSPAETAMHIGRLKEIYERQHPRQRSMAGIARDQAANFAT